MLLVHVSNGSLVIRLHRIHFRSELINFRVVCLEHLCCPGFHIGDDGLVLIGHIGDGSLMFRFQFIDLGLVLLSQLGCGRLELLDVSRVICLHLIPVGLELLVVFAFLVVLLLEIFRCLLELRAGCIFILQTLLEQGDGGRLLLGLCCGRLPGFFHFLLELGILVSLVCAIRLGFLEQGIQVADRFYSFLALDLHLFMCLDLVGIGCLSLV
mmetsp:Transcript_19898/g.47825  ORF Transcript_19898/g.47825 Transcript_19898/m.47825 type:complete len:211 (-) Transcript_19898:1594-2226(-)